LLNEAKPSLTTVSRGGNSLFAEVSVNKCFVI
jgi:hypothetical protein